MRVCKFMGWQYYRADAERQARIVTGSRAYHNNEIGLDQFKLKT